jgi:type I restriction enzyme S subunit
MSWPDVPLRDLIGFSRDGEWGAAKATNDSVEVAVIRGTDFEKVATGDATGLPLRHVAAKRVAGKALLPGDIVIETAGGSKDRSTGRTLLISDRLADRVTFPLVCASFCRSIRITPEAAHPSYVYWYLRYLYTVGLMAPFHTQHTGVARFQWTDFASACRVPLPPRGVQHRIAVVLSAFDQLVELNERRIELLEGLARSLYREWFVHFRFPGHNDAELVDSKLGPIPEGWQIRALEEIATVNDESFKVADIPDPFEYLDISTVGVGRVAEPTPIAAAEAPGRARRRVRDGDVVWATVRPNRRAHGLIHDPSPVLVASTGLAVLSPKAIPPSFLFAYAGDQPFTDYLTSRATGSAYPAVRPKDFCEAAVVVPPQGMLEQFDAVVDPALRSVSTLRETNRQLAATRDLLLPRLVTGRLDISEVDLGVLTPPDPA